MTETTVPVGAGRLIGAIVAAAAMQVGTVVASFISFVIWLLAHTEGFFGSNAEPEWWGAFAVPVLLAGGVLWIGSGWVAARILRTRVGWLTLLMLPAVTIGVPSLAAMC